MRSRRSTGNLRVRRDLKVKNMAGGVTKGAVETRQECEASGLNRAILLGFWSSPKTIEWQLL